MSATDRERWFSAVIGGRFEQDTETPEKLAAVIALPEHAARELALRLRT